MLLTPHILAVSLCECFKNSSVSKRKVLPYIVGMDRPSDRGKVSKVVIELNL